MNTTQEHWSQVCGSTYADQVSRFRPTRRTPRLGVRTPGRKRQGLSTGTAQRQAWSSAWPRGRSRSEHRTPEPRATRAQRLRQPPWTAWWSSLSRACSLLLSDRESGETEFGFDRVPGAFSDGLLGELALNRPQLTNPGWRSVNCARLISSGATAAASPTSSRAGSDRLPARLLCIGSAVRGAHARGPAPRALRIHSTSDGSTSYMSPVYTYPIGYLTD